MERTPDSIWGGEGGSVNYVWVGGGTSRHIVIERKTIGNVGREVRTVCVGGGGRHFAQEETSDSLRRE